MNKMIMDLKRFLKTAKNLSILQRSKNIDDVSFRVPLDHPKLAGETNLRTLHMYQMI